MTEPATASVPEAIRTNGPVSDDSTRGRPYYEKLRKDLRSTIERKRELDRSMATIETTISRLENNYLEETNAAGNIIKGFDNYIKASSSTTASSSGPGTATRRKGGVNDQDRIFSRSSVSWAVRETSPMTLNLSAGSASGGRGPMDSAGLSMASGAGSARDTPTSTGGSNSNKTSYKNKKKAGPDRDKEDATLDGERPTKRGKVSWGPRE